MALSPFAGLPPAPDTLVDIPSLVSAYYTGIPDPSSPDQRVAFGTSGHRGGSLRNSFNETHILAITQAICNYRKQKGIDGPVFMGMDTHALSTPAQATALEVLAANGVETMIATNDDYTPTPAVSHAILKYNEGRRRHHHHSLTQSARRRRLQIQPAQRRSRRYGHYQMDRVRRQHSSRGRRQRRHPRDQTHPPVPIAKSLHYPPPRLSQQLC